MIFEKDLLKMTDEDLVKLQDSVKDILKQRKDLEAEKLVQQFFDLRKKISEMGIIGEVEVEFFDECYGNANYETVDIFDPATEVEIRKNYYY